MHLTVCVCKTMLFPSALRTYSRVDLSTTTTTMRIINSFIRSSASPLKNALRVIFLAISIDAFEFNGPGKRHINRRKTRLPL